MLYLVFQVPKLKYRDVFHTQIAVVEAKSEKEAIRSISVQTDPAYCKPRSTKVIPGKTLMI